MLKQCYMILHVYTCSLHKIKVVEFIILSLLSFVKLLCKKILFAFINNDCWSLA